MYDPTTTIYDKAVEFEMRVVGTRVGLETGFEERLGWLPKVLSRARLLDTRPRNTGNEGFAVTFIYVGLLCISV